ncbi:MAG: glycosyltransferase family 2 protein [Phocaeicola sp.]
MVALTIIIPHKNSPALLSRCLDSIPCRKDIRIIVVDDNSDSTRVDFSQFPGRDKAHVKIIETKEGYGAGYARNIGLEQADSKWVMFADADDYFTDQLSSCLDSYVDSDLDYILFPLAKEFSTNSTLEDRSRYFEELLASNRSTLEKALRMQIPTSKLINFQVIKENQIKFQEVRYSNDVFFSVQLAVKAKRIRVDNRFRVYTLTSTAGSLTKQLDAVALKCRLEVCLKSYQYLKEKDLSSKMWQINKHFLYWAGQISLLEVMKTFLTLLKCGLFFYGNDIQRDGYYNTPLYFLYYAIFRMKRETLKRKE